MGTRKRMLSTAMRLIQQQGVAATGVLQVLAEADAPRGSLYHHFPGGKSQLVTEALQLNADLVTQALSGIIARAPDSQTALVEYANFLASALESTGFQSGCPLATAVLEQAATDDAIAEICNGAFTTWREVAGDQLRRQGVEEADEVALLIVAGFEGALVLARAKRDAEPLRRVAQILGSILQGSMKPTSRNDAGDFSADGL